MDPVYREPSIEERMHAEEIRRFTEYEARNRADGAPAITEPHPAPEPAPVDEPAPEPEPEPLMAAEPEGVPDDGGETDTDAEPAA